MREGKSELAASGTEGRKSKQDSQAADGRHGIGRLSATRSAAMQLHVRYGHTHSTMMLDGVWSVGCVSHRLGVVARSKSDGAVASSSTRALLGSIYGTSRTSKGRLGSWRYWPRWFAHSYINSLVI